MPKNGVCAVVITFRPAADVLMNLSKVRPQVQGLVVVDNGSPEESLAPFLAAERQMELTLIRNGQNLGIAAALNIGVRWAQSQGFERVVLFDQDSTVTDGFMQAMLDEYESHPQREKVAIVTPSQVERNTGRARVVGSSKDGGPLVAITSGSLMPIGIFDRCGWFEEDLIIDCVDHEYCLRARSLGYTLAHSRRAVLLVNVGTCQEYRVFGMRISSATHHSAKRRYYITRNRLVVVQRCWRQQPLWCYCAVRDIAKDTLKIALFETHRWSKLVNTARGIVDALLGRMGKVVDL
jgi:rhamnosyltransferase